MLGVGVAEDDAVDEVCLGARVVEFFFCLFLPAPELACFALSAMRCVMVVSKVSMLLSGFLI